MPVWQINGIAAWLLIGVYWLGWLIVLASTFMIDHFDLSGLRQAFFALRGAEYRVNRSRRPCSTKSFVIRSCWAFFSHSGPRLR